MNMVASLEEAAHILVTKFLLQNTALIEICSSGDMI